MGRLHQVDAVARVIGLHLVPYHCIFLPFSHLSATYLITSKGLTHQYTMHPRTLLALSVLRGVSAGVDSSFASTARDKLVYGCLTGGANTTDSEPCRLWVEEMANDAWPAVFLFVLLIGIAIWRCARCCCKCCGSSVPSGGCCGGQSALECDDNSVQDPNRKPFTGYGSCSRLIFRVTLILTFAGAVAIIGPGLALNTQVTDGVVRIGNNIDRMIEDVADALAFVNKSVVSLPDVKAADRAMISTQTRQVNDALEEMENFKQDYLYRYNHVETGYSREDATVIFGAVVLFMFLLIALVGLLGCHRCCLPGVVFCFMVLVMLIMMVVTLIHHFLGMATVDVCGNYDSLMAELVRKVEDQLGCRPWSTDRLAQINQIVDTVKADVMQRMCTDLLTQGGMPDVFGYSVPSLCGGGITIQAFFRGLLASTVVTDGTGSIQVYNNVVLQSCTAPCDMRKCAESCPSPLRELTREIVTTWGIYDPVITTYELEVLPISTCLTLGQLVGRVKNPFCNDIKEPVLSLFFICIFSMCLAVVAAVLMTLGTKRFIPGARAGMVVCTGTTQAQRHQSKGEV